MVGPVARCSRPRKRWNRRRQPSFKSVFFWNNRSRIGRRPVRWRTRKARDRLLFSGVAPWTQKSRASLVESIFPEATEDQLVHQVKNTLSVLRSSLEKAGFPDMLLSAGGYYWLDESRIDSEFDRFRMLMRDMAGPDRDTRLTALREVCGMHQGELCADMEFLPLPRLRAQIRGQLESALLTTIQEQVASRSLADALAFADSLCQMSPDNREYHSIRQALRDRTSS